MIRLWLHMAWVGWRYWIRPFDMLADKRRWRWQRATHCGLPCGFPVTEDDLVRAIVPDPLDSL